MSDKVRWLMHDKSVVTANCKRFSLMDKGILICFSYNFVREKVQWHFREINSKNIYVKNIEKKDTVNLNVQTISLRFSIKKYDTWKHIYNVVIIFHVRNSHEIIPTT
jgi:hypothetical protein